MTKPSSDHLTDIELFRMDTVPKGRRESMKRVLEERRATIGRAVSSGAVMALASSFCVLYGAISAFAWTSSAPISFGVLFSVFSGVLFVASLVLSEKFFGHLREVVIVPERLRVQASIEAQFEETALDVNLRAIFWNDAAKLARTNDVGETVLNSLRVQRAAILRDRFEVTDALRRINLATSPETRAENRSDTDS